MNVYLYLLLYLQIYLNLLMVLAIIYDIFNLTFIIIYRDMIEMIELR